MLRVNQLTGFGIARALTAVTQVLSATAIAGSTITFPADIQAGDLIVVLDVSIAASAPTAVTPSGFTLISNQLATTGNDLRTVVSYKLALGTETGALTCMAENLATNKVMVVFRGDAAATLLTLVGLQEEVTSGNPVPQVVPSAAGVPPLVVFGCYSCGDPIAPRTMSPAKDGELNAGDTWIAWKIYNTAPADVTVDMDDEGDRNTLSSFYIQMAA